MEAWHAGSHQCGVVRINPAPAAARKRRGTAVDTLGDGRLKKAGLIVRVTYRAVVLVRGTLVKYGLQSASQGAHLVARSVGARGGRCTLGRVVRADRPRGERSLTK